MPSRRRIVIAQRRWIFVGCEGSSEQSYVRVLQDLCDAAGVEPELQLFLREIGLIS